MADNEQPVLSVAKESLPDPNQSFYEAWLKSSQDRSISGSLFTGVVVENVDPLELGRVKVMINGITPTITSAIAAKWAWTMNTFGGGQTENNQKRYGACFPFPIGSKIYVIFQESDTNYANPVVIGGFYQDSRIPPQIFDRKKPGGHVPRAWGYVSPKGHSILCREEDEEESIELISHKGRKIIISDKVDQELIGCYGVKGGVVELFEGKEGTIIKLLDPSGQTITIDEQKKTITVQAKMLVEVQSGQDIMLTASKSITLSAPLISLLGEVVPCCGGA